MQNGQGSRTSVLLALARVSGLRTALLLARKINRPCGRNELSCYSEPLVRFWFSDGQIVDVDAESDDLPFGSVPPVLDAKESLLVQLAPGDGKPEIVALSFRPGLERSTADGELSLQHGDLVADLQIRLGAARAQEVRALLRTAGEQERKAFFEQLAMRIFPEAAAITGSAAHVGDPELQLELSLHCVVPQFMNRENAAIDIDQLAPTLGLRGTYAKLPGRKFPLYIDSLFFESTTFHLHLPAGARVRSLPSELSLHGEFGDYGLRFVASPQQLDIHREFRVPVQVIAPEKYPAFLRFARQIEDAERQRISLAVGKDLGSPQYRVPPATGMFR